MSVVSSIMQYRQGIDHVPAIRWGRENEDRARKEYVTQVKAQHHDINVHCCGLVVNLNHPFLEASPDGMVSCTCCREPDLLEIKCPYKYRFQLPTSEAPLSDLKFCP